MTDIIAEDSLSCPPSPASVETLLPVPHESLRTEGFVVDAKELNDLNWVIYPGTISSCFGVANDVYTKDPSQQAFVEIQRLKSALLNLDSKIQLLEDTFESSVLSIWKTELKLISFSFISCFFSPKGVESAQDFRFHLSLIKDYFLLGSPQFSMGLTDAMFKASPHGLNLNGPHSNGIVSELNMLLLEILKPVEWLDFDIASLVNGKSDINKGVNVSTALRLNYDPPAPLDIIITESAVSRLSSIFSFLLLIFQAQEAIERIYQSPRWKALKHLKENNAQNAIMIRFIHMAHVFLTSLEHYVFQSAVNSPWDYFLNQVEDLVSSSSILSFDVNSKASIENLQFQFENCTNEILWRLFLFDRDQRLLSNQLAFLLKLLIEFSRSVQTSGHTTSFARLYFDFDAGFKSLLYLLKDSFQKEEFSDVAYQRSFEPFYELFIGLGGAI